MSLRRKFLRFVFHLLYNQFAFTYDLVASLVSFGQWKNWGRTSLSRVHGDRILELGHGPGHLLIALARSGRTPIGIDLSPHMSRIARSNLRRAKLNVPHVRGRSQALPFRSNSFEASVATFPTEYIVDPKTLSEVRRVTNDRGRLVIVAGAQIGTRKPSARLIHWLYRVTGQKDALPNGSESVFTQVNMPAHTETELIGHSQVLLVIAEKISPDNKLAPSSD
ncbi:MAG TPA: methyltransferase domain-containing protein [Anaerolineae bacterium]|nr:methyltransferase domain-containing protein [Anaerolineae bacterium]